MDWYEVLSEPQTVDKTKVFRQMDESFGQAFSKACAVEAAEASSRSAEREISLSALLFCELFSCAYIAKRKAAGEFVHCYKLYTFGLQPTAEASASAVLPFLRIRRKISKKSLTNRGKCVIIFHI